MFKVSHFCHPYEVLGELESVLTTELCAGPSSCLSYTVLLHSSMLRCPYYLALLCKYRNISVPLIH